MTGQDNAAGPAWTPEEIAATGEFTRKWTNELVDGEIVDAADLAAPVHTRRDGEPV